MRTSAKFERQIKRIHDLIKQPGSKVTWNDSVPDPDNPEQPRQIDITICRENTITMVECRIHSKKQDVKWIEELIGRRSSLKADTVIAVSASGFTKGAIKKAKAYGIILRDIVSLTEEEIREWGGRTDVWLTFISFKDIWIKFFFDTKYQKEITLDEICKNFQETDILYCFFNDVMKKIEENPTKLPGRIKVTFNSPTVKIGEKEICRVQFEANFEFISRSLKTPSIVVYDAPEVKGLSRSIKIEKIDLGESQMTYSCDNLSFVMDLSQIVAPPNSLFRSIDFKMKRQGTLKGFEIIPPKMQMFLNEIKIGIEFINQ